MGDVLKKVPVREQDAKVRATNFEEVCLGYNKEEAVEEANRCLTCKNAKCVKGCPVNIDIPGFIKEVKEVLGNNTCIIQLNENNLLNETFYIQQWCKEQFIQQDKNRYEKEKQEKLQNIMFFLDKLEENIFK